VGVVTAVVAGLGYGRWLGWWRAVVVDCRV